MYTDRAPLPPLRPAPVTPLTCGDASGALLHALARLEQAVDQETELLSRRSALDLGDFNLRKSHGLLELTRALRGVDAGALKPEVIERVRGLREKLDRNRTALAVHLAATREIADLVATAIQNAESDGTYGVGGGRSRSAGAW